MGLFNLDRVFGRFRSSSKKAADKTYIAVERTNLPLDSFMTRLMVEELPMLDSTDRRRIYQIFEEYDGPIITSQDELPEEIRRLMDL